jgi:putative salt-induced outer membrane protein
MARPDAPCLQGSFVCRLQLTSIATIVKRGSLICCACDAPFGRFEVYNKAARKATQDRLVADLVLGMKQMFRTVFIGIALAIMTVSPAAAQELPEALADLIREATPSERATIENVAKRVYPDRRSAVDDLVDAIEDEEEAQVAASRFLRGWTGEVALGASIASGNTDEWNLSGSTRLRRSGPKWEHRFDAGIDLRNVDGEKTDERIFAGYRASLDFDDSDFFMVGSFRYERDRFKDIDRRFTEALGLGYDLINTDRLSWEITAGPALRQTLYSYGKEERQLAAFAATEIEWDITDTLTFLQEARFVLDSENNSLEATTSLTKDLFGRFYARMSFTVLSESNPPLGNEKVDTRSRASLVMDF